MPSNLDHVYQLILADLLSFNPKHPMKNLTNSENSALDDLIDDEFIVIKKADKGSNIVIQDRKDYIKEGLRQLSNREVYMQTLTDNSPMFKQKTVKIIEDLYTHQQISKKTYQYLSDGGERTLIFYMLPKIHKNRHTPPGRPIVSSIGSHTEKLSQMIDLILQPYAMKGQSYIKDTSDFILKIKDLTLEPDEWIFIMDVTSLYTNIPHDKGIRAVKNVIQMRNSLPANEYILRILNLVLKCNSFRFNENYYVQINGTAMGTRVAPTYAVIFMNAFEEDHIFHISNIWKWYRFIDDIWGIFKGTKFELLKFFEYCNSVHNTIKFSFEYSQSSVDFLDVTTYIHDRKILVKPFFKKTESHSYLDYRSCHPIHNKTSIPYSQFLRMRRNSTEWSEFISGSIRIALHLILRGYPEKLVFDLLLKVNRLSQIDALSQTNHPSDDNKLFLILDYNPSNPPLRSYISEYWPILDRSSSTRSLVNMRIIFGFRKPKSLMDLLCHSDIRKKLSI